MSNCADPTKVYGPRGEELAPKRRPTSHDVARAAGVSRATVSYVLNDVTRQRISPEVQERVWKAVENCITRPTTTPGC